MNSFYLSTDTLENIADIKYHFLEALVHNGFIDMSLGKCQTVVDTVALVSRTELKYLNINNENANLLRGLIAAALYPNVAKVFGQFSIHVKKFISKGTEVFLHPSSIGFSLAINPPTRHLVYQEKLKTKKLNISEISFVPTLSLLMLASSSINIEVAVYGTYRYILSSEDGLIKLSIGTYRVMYLTNLNVKKISNFNLFYYYYYYFLNYRKLNY